MAMKGFEPSKYFQAILVSFLLIETVSFLLYTFADIPLIKLGWLFMVSLIIVVISTLFTLGININQMDKNSIIFIFIVLAAIIALLFFLPKIIPEIFQIYNPSGIEYSEAIRQNLNSILSWG
jgi:ABC-type multidrug transport system permease subunit